MVKTVIRARFIKDGKTTRIKLWRDEIQRITNRQLAEKLGSYPEELISRIVGGEYEPSKQLMKKFCRLMDVDLGVIWELVPERKEDGKRPRG